MRFIFSSTLGPDRPILDSTDKGSLYLVLNTIFCKMTADEHWGSINHPTLDHIVLSYLKLCEKHPNVRWPHLQAWKMDLKDAFTLMSYKSTDAQKFAIELVNGIAIIFCAVFLSRQPLRHVSRSSLAQSPTNYVKYCCCARLCMLMTLWFLAHYLRRTGSCGR